MKQPQFWFRSPDHTGILPKLLAPLAGVWRIVVQRRWKSGAHTKLPVPVICVGNINMGGTGKTPTVIAIVEQLEKLKKSAHVVSRGYGGKLAGPVRVDLRNHKAEETGDEPLLLAAFAPCWVASDRLEGAKAAIAAGADVVVLDDGMQNPALAKDLTIMVVDAEIGYGNGRIFPAGPLRQSVEEGLERSDMILVIGRPEAQTSFLENWPDVQSTPLVSAVLQPLNTGMDWQGLKAVAFAGIGRPAKFFKTLRMVGAEPVACHSFADHQKMPLAVLKRMESEARQLGAQLVTTEKDAVRLPASFQQKVLTLPVRLELEDPALLDETLQTLFD